MWKGKNIKSGWEVRWVEVSGVRGRRNVVEGVRCREVSDQAQGRIGSEGLWIIGLWCCNLGDGFQLLSKKAIRKSLRYFATNGGRL